MHQALLSFNAGEVTPYMRHRIDFDKNGSSAERMENFMAQPYGGAMKRPGLEHLAVVAGHDAAGGMMLPFVASDGSRSLLLFSEDKLRIVDDTGTKLAELDYLSDSNISHTYQSGVDSLREIQITRINDVAFLTHPAIQPTRLSRISETSWKLEPVPFIYPPLLDDNSDENNKLVITDPTPEAAAWSGSSVTYAVGAKVTYSDSTYVCLYAHVSSSSRYPVAGDDIYETNNFAVDGYYFVGWSSNNGQFVATFKPYWALALGGAVPGTAFEVLSPGQIFKPGHVGAIFKFAKQRTASDGLKKLEAISGNNGITTDPIYVDKDWVFSTYGTWDGEWVIQTSKTGGEWKEIRRYSGKANRNVNEAGTVEKPCFIRVKWEHGNAGSSNPFGQIETAEPYMSGLIRITEVTNAGQAKAIGVTHVFPGTSDVWAEGAFSKYQGYPSASCLHESRLVFASTSLRPVSLWLSATDDFINFETGPEASDGIFATLSASNSEPIRWMVSQRRLFLGTSNSEYVSGSETADQPLSPTNFVARRYTTTGSMPAQAVVYADGILFAGRGGGRLHEIGYSAERGSYDSTDLSRLAEHLTRPGIRAIAYQQTREPGLWVVREDGMLLHLAYSRADVIAAWTKHSSNGALFRDVAVFERDAGDDDVFFMVDRNGSACLERFPRQWQETMETTDGLEFFHLDGVRGNGTSVNVPAHLIGLPSVLLTKEAGSALPTVREMTATAATIDLGAVMDWQYGQPVESIIESLPIDMGADNGTTQARQKRIHKLAVSIYRSRGGHVWNQNLARRQPIPNTQPAAILRSGWEEIIPDSGTVVDMHFRLYHADPFPFCLRAGIIRWALQEK